MYRYSRLLAAAACCALLLLSAVPLLVHADNPLPNAPGQLLITEIQTGSGQGASEEFIELYNATTQPVDFAAGHWQLQIADAAAGDWTVPHRSIALTGTLLPGSYYLLASKVTASGEAIKYLPATANDWFSAGIAAAAGHVRLLRTINQTAADGSCTPRQLVSDEVEWSEVANGLPLHASLDARTSFNADAGGIAPGKSLQRMQDTDNDTADFVLGDPTPGAGAMAAPSAALETPQDACVLAAPSEPEAPAVDDPAPVVPPADIGLTAPQISELLPNPAAPLSDASDEFIELYNPNGAPFDLSGFTLQTGSAAKHSYVFPKDTVLPSVGFAAFYARDTELVLSNTASQVTLLDPLGAVVAQSDAYSKAPSGQSWLLADNVWQWTDKPTPGEANHLSLPAPAQPAAAVAAPKKATAKVSSPAVKAAKTTKVAAKPKAAKTAAKAPAVQSARLPDPPPKGSLHIGVLAVVAAIAVVYGAYEYKTELSNKFYQLRANRSAGRKNGSGA
ncbi:MAG TPA: lamin tail domain-containing protein [Bacillota bacterium]|nr:lamin tail domain-containing protein [Bacillota bacterium]